MFGHLPFGDVGFRELEWGESDMMNWFASSSVWNRSLKLPRPSQAWVFILLIRKPDALSSIPLFFLFHDDFQ